MRTYKTIGIDLVKDERNKSLIAGHLTANLDAISIWKVDLKQAWLI